MTRWLSDFLLGCVIQVNVNGFLSNQINLRAGVPQGSVLICIFPDLHQRASYTTPQTNLTIPICWWYCKMGLQLKCMFCSKTFATGPSKLGNVVCQMENQTEHRENQGDHILQVQTQQKNRTQCKTVWRDTKSLSSSEISRNYFWLPIHFPKTLWGHPGPLQHQLPPIKATS